MIIQSVLAGKIKRRRLKPEEFKVLMFFKIRVMLKSLIRIR